MLLQTIFFQYLQKYGGFTRRKSDSLWKEMEMKIEGRSWQSLRGRFLRHFMGNMAKFKVTKAQLVEADERVMEETGKTSGDGFTAVRKRSIHDRLGR